MVKGKEAAVNLPWRIQTSSSSRPSSPALGAESPTGAVTPRRRSFAPGRDSLQGRDGLRLDDAELADFKRVHRSPVDHDRRRPRIPAWLPAYAPLIVWLLVSVITTLLVSVFHNEVFGALESLSLYLKDAGLSGYLLIFLVIAITCIPPCPFYGTLIILTGYTYGVWRAFVVSYAAALFGAVAVYLLCRNFFRETMSAHLRKSPGMRKVINACSVRPRLLFLIRLAPYPYNLVNALSAASDQLTFSTYFWCTALSLPKLLVHTSIGASIRSFVQYHHASNASSSTSSFSGEPLMDEDGQRIKVIFGALGIGLCVVVFAWLFLLARKAIDETEEPWSAESKRTPMLASSSTLTAIDIDRPRSAAI